MGQSCTKVCYAEQHTSSGGGCVEGSRADSPDPVMYDLMRKSILATSQSGSGVGNGSGGGGGVSGSKKRPLFCGQQHLLFKNHNCSSRQAHHHLSPTVTSSSGSPFVVNNGSSSLAILPPPPNPTPMSSPAFPTRLLIRRRSLRVVEEGGGTHIYAIRYPEDTTATVVSEHAASFPANGKQEQCPPRRSVAKENNSKSSTAVSHGNASTSNSANLAISLPPIPMDGDVFTKAAMASIPRQPGKFERAFCRLKTSCLR